MLQLSFESATPGSGSATCRPGSRRSRVICTLLLTLALLSGCSSGHHKPAIHGEMTVGILAPLSGREASVGRDLVNGASLAVAEFNNGHGVLGHEVHLQVEDDGCAPQQATRAAERLIRAHVVGVVGGVCDASTTTAVAALSHAGVPTLVTSADADALAGTNRPSIFMLNGTVYQQGLAALHWIAYRSAQRVAVVNDSSPEAAELSRVVAHGIDVPLAGTQTVPPGRDMAQVATATLRPHPAFVYWAGSAEGGGRLLRGLRSKGYSGEFMASSASDGPAFVGAAGNEAADGAFITTLARPDWVHTAKAWADGYHTKYHRQPGRAAMQAYDGVRALVQAVRQAHNARSKAVSTALAGIRGFSTFLGPLQFAPDHTMADDNAVIAVVKSGAITLASPLRSD